VLSQSQQAETAFTVCQAWLAARAAALRSTSLEQRLWARTLPSVGGSTPLDTAREALYRDLARGYRDRCLRVRLRTYSVYRCM